MTCHAVAAFLLHRASDLAIICHNKFNMTIHMPTLNGLETMFLIMVVFYKQKSAYEMRISDWSSDVCSSELVGRGVYVIEADGVEVGFVPVRPDHKEADKSLAQKNAAGEMSLPAPESEAA